MASNKKAMRRALSLMLTAAMTVSMLPGTIFAAESGLIEDNDQIVQWTDNGWGVWNNEVHFRETDYDATAEEAFDTVTVPFTGTGIQVYGKKASNGNIMTASVDGGKAVDVDFFGNQGAGGKQLVWEIKGLEPGEHKLVMTNTNRHNEKAAPLPNATGKYQPEINYFMVLNEEAEKPEVPEVNFADGINDKWTVDNQKDGIICAVEDGWLHLKSSPANGNNPGTEGKGPAMFVNPTKFDFTKEGFFEFTLKSNNDNSQQAGSDRFGVFLGYSPATASTKETGMFLGYDNGGWFWQKYAGTSEPWYSGGRVAAPAQDTEVQVRIEWTADKKVTLTVGDKVAFNKEDFSILGDKLTGTIAFKGGSWGEKAQTDVMLKNIKYTGQAQVEAYEVAGTVVDENGAALAGASVEINGKIVMTNDKGEFTFAGENRLPDGEYTATVTKEGYSVAKAAVKVAGKAVTVEKVTLKELAGVTGTVLGAESKPVPFAAVTVSKEGFTKTVYADEKGAFTMKGLAAGEYEIAATGDFHYTSDKQPLVVSEDGNAEVAVVLAPMKTAVLTTGAMDVTVSTDFPSVLKYDMKGDLAGKTMYGQTRSINQVLINNTQWVKVENVKATPVGANVMKYEMPVVAKAAGIDVNAVIHAELRAEGNVLTFTITGVDYPRDDRLVNPVEQIYIFDHSLASVRSSQENAKVATASLAANTITSGDRFADVNGDFNPGSFNLKAARYAFLSNSELSAGVFSNSDIGNGGAGSDNNRVMTTAVDRGAYKNVAAGSNQWYYDRKISSVDPANAADVENVLSAEQKVVGIREGRDQAPYAKVVITGEQNNDGMVNWQDAAIAARDQEVVHIPVHSDKVPEVITTRIAMNFESEAPNPFLTTLDNVKRVALHSDGLGQSVLLKGYASEGHDSGHPDYYDIGERMGGVEDFKTMLHEGHKYGAQFGIHTNASEFYPEADAFNDNAVRWDGSRAKGAPKVHYGWNWLDQGIAMNGVYDLAIDGRYNRFKMLHDLVGDNTYGGDGLDYIYVDVWGNFTSGSEQAWHTRKLSNDITAGGNNWRIVHEWAFANEWDSTFQHWVSDYAYGNYGDKGKLNSEIMRFMLNSHKDSWVPDFPTYGGAANAPLLGGPVMQGFEGWQSDYEYDLFIDTLYNEMLPTKFLQHYDIMKWVDNDEAVTLPYGDNAYQMSWGNTSKWTPEVQIELRGQDDKNDKVVVTRGSDGEINDTYSYPQNDAAARREYRSRHITLNGRVVLVGASNPGDFQANKSVDGDLRYLLPWYWDKDGKVVGSADEKLYHYNVKGGETKWQLPEGWENLENVIVYKLTDLGRTEETKVAVKDGYVTLNAEAEIPYIVVKGTQGAKAPVVEWTAEGQHLSDVSFNSVLTDHWAVTGNCEIAKTTHETPMLKITGEGSVSQKLTDLKADEKYAVYVGVDNRSDVKATIQILDSKGNEVASEYTLRSFVPNAVGSYVHQNRGDASNFQNMYVFFTPKANETYTVVLSHEAGEGYAHFDDVRVAERGILNVQKKGEAGAPGVVEIKDHFTYDEKGNFVKYEQDFEHVAQGLYPFVAYNGGQVTDCRMHLSKLHAPYTQAGWDTKKADDVLGGNWSIKINGQTGRNSLMYTTVPQNFHFEPGKYYTVEFDYQMGSEGTYEAVVLDGGVRANNVVKRYSLEKSLGETAHAKLLVLGAESGQTGFGIWSTGRGAQVPSGAHADFGGYKDFMLDNLVIKPAGEVVQVEILDTNLNKGEMTEYVITTNMENGGIDHWTNSNNKVAIVDGTQIKAIGGGTTTLTAYLTNGESKSFEITVTAEADMDITGKATANTEEKGGEGPVSGYAQAASDGKASTFWHSAWSSGSFKVSAENPAVLTVDFGAPQSGDYFFLQQRPSGPNGIVNEFKYRVMDGAKKVLHEGTVKVPSAQRANGAIIKVDCDMTGAQIIEISVTNGGGGFAALAEVGLPRVHYVFAEEATIADVNVGTDETTKMEITTAPGEVLMGAQWSVADPEIAVVNANGVVTGVKEGETTITLSNAFGDLATAKVTVALSDTTKARADQIVTEIDAIGEVTLESQFTIAMARAHYDNLSAAAKALVTNLDKLEAAEAALDALLNVSFPDIHEGQWFYNAAIYSAQHGFIDGLKDGTFGPDVTMTRAQLVQMLYAFEGKPEVEKTDKFVDVADNAWFADAVAWADEKGVAHGVSDTTFAPDEIITRQEMAMMLYAFANKPEVESDLEFADVDAIAPWAAKAVQWVVENGLMNGVPGNKFAPTATGSRAQAAVIMMNLDQM